MRALRPFARKPAPPKPSLTLPRGASRNGTASRLLVLLTELTELTDIARPRLTAPVLEPPSLASPLPLRLPEARLLEEEYGADAEAAVRYIPEDKAVAARVLWDSED